MTSEEGFVFTGREHLLAVIRSERQALEEALGRCSPADLQAPNTVGTWSIKDCLAHISTWERWMLSWVGSLQRGEAPQVPETWDVDRMNAEAHARHHGLPLEAVLSEFRQSYTDALALAESLGEEEYKTEHPDTWPMGPLWLGVAANMNFHYNDHRRDIERFLETRGSRE